jgi:hypothetical protein
VNSYSTATSTSASTETHNNTKESNQAWAEMMKLRIDSVKSRQVHATHDLETTIDEYKKHLSVLTESLDALEKQHNSDLNKPDLKFQLNFTKSDLTDTKRHTIPTVNYTVPEFNNPVRNSKNDQMPIFPLKFIQPKTAAKPAPIPVQPPKINIDAQKLWNRLDQIKNAPFQTLKRRESGYQSLEFQQDEDQNDKPEIEIVEIDDCDSSDSVKVRNLTNSSSSDSYVVKD